MSDCFQMLVDADVSIDRAKDTSRAVVAEFRRRGLITGRASGDCVLGGKGYHPGPSVPAFCAIRKGECRFWELVTCGVQVTVGRGFNDWALGPACEGSSGHARLCLIVAPATVHSVDKSDVTSFNKPSGQP